MLQCKARRSEEVVSFGHGRYRERSVKAGRIRRNRRLKWHRLIAAFEAGSWRRRVGNRDGEDGSDSNRSNIVVPSRVGNSDVLISSSS